MGQAAPCTSAGTIWRDSSTGLITGTLNFGSSLNASHIWSYCTVSNASNTLTAGEYTDQVQLTLRYPNTVAGQLLSVPLNLQFGVQVQCLIDRPIPSLAVNYTSFQNTAMTNQMAVLIRCNTNTPWSVGLQGPTAPNATPVATLNNQRLLGLNYTLQVSPSSGIGKGNIGTGQSANEGQQPVTIQLTVPAHQMGNCSMGTCTASNVHTLVVTY